MIILGCPLKISAMKAIYFPRLYLEHFGIDTCKGIVIREYHGNYFIYRSYMEQPLADNEKKVVIRACSTYIPTAFLERNQLVPGQDFLYLIGIDDGLKVSVNKQML